MSPRGLLEGPRFRCDGTERMVCCFTTGWLLQKRERGSLAFVQLMERQTLVCAANCDVVVVVSGAKRSAAAEDNLSCPVQQSLSVVGVVRD